MHRSDFPIFEKHPGLAYLDNAATTQRPGVVIDALTQFYREENANIHRGIYDLSNQATTHYEAVRKATGRFIGSPTPANIAFTSGTTASINMVARSFVQPQLQSGDNIVTTVMEHHANFLPWQVICKENSAELRLLKTNESGDLLLDELRQLLSDRTKILAITHISNTLGTINDLEEIIAMAHEKGVPVLVDAAQSAAYYDLQVNKLDCDFLAFSGHKLFGPFGVGILYVRDKYIDQMTPYNYGGGMIRQVSVEGSDFASFPRGLEAGTPDIAAVIGLGAAIQYIESLDKIKVRAHIHQLTAYATARLSEIPEINIIGSPQQKSGITSFIVKDIHPHDVASFLNKDDIAVRAGMHCTQPLLTHLNLNATVRVSFSIYNSQDEIDRLYHALVELINFWQGNDD